MGFLDRFKPKQPEQQFIQQSPQTQAPFFYSFIDTTGKKCNISISQESPESFSPNQQEVADNNPNSKLCTAKIGYTQDHSRLHLNETITFGCCDLSLLEYMKDEQQPALAGFFKEFFSEKRVSGKLRHEEVNGDYIGSILYTDEGHSQIDKFINPEEQRASVPKVQQKREVQRAKEIQRLEDNEQREQQRLQELLGKNNYIPPQPQNRNRKPEITKTSPEGKDSFSFIDVNGYVANLSNLESEGKAPDGFQLYKAVISHAKQEGYAAKFKDIAFELPAEMGNFFKDPKFAEVAADFFSKSRVDRIKISDKEYIGGMREVEGKGWGKFTNHAVEKMVEAKNMAHRGR